MGVEAQFTTEVVRGRFEAFLQEIVRQQVEALQQLGEMCVAHARSIPKEQGFEDQTGNLRSSIGYVVFVDGVAVHSLYEEVKGGSVGAKTGEALAHKVGQGTQGVCLVVTAGMNYALHVESRGRDVIASAEQLAERELPRMIEQLISDIKSI
ncbi:hypothetical protein [Porphyromonas gingivalis]|uniref:Uncharacterized protein n=2 Tax=root TaxID=1 RepID=A0AAF0BEQ0_PORGN|nr:hypothetical protein [Porphyromonas gingivalis]WCG02573.1 hypothetical protein NY151_07890 [Porphyromonas gingivalis]SJL29038.1 hypothetical protein PGIN_ATCC49417_00828 [Porphyromonas gingivalis]